MSAIDLKDVQGNVLRGYRAKRARHFALGVESAPAARAFLGTLVSGDDRTAPQVTPGEWDNQPQSMLNVAISWSGLEALGIPAATLAAFPEAFREGAAARSAKEPNVPDLDVPDLGDTGPSAPDHWWLGGTGNPPAHLIVSLYATSDEPPDKETERLRALFAAHALTEHHIQETHQLDGGRVHFGYLDGIGQPTIKGVPGKRGRDRQPACEPGEFLLGKDYVNQYGGNFRKDLPAKLVDNATYGVFRVLVQDVHAFERFLRDAGKRFHMHPELVAAKLVGRWRNGVPLTLSPSTPYPPGFAAASLNDFDYGPAPAHPAFYDDAEGLRCPIGSHIRRLNPRGSIVMGKPHSRRIIRRGMAFGPPYEPSIRLMQPGEPGYEQARAFDASYDAAAWDRLPADEGDEERGLAGFFFCGDIEMQFEFLQRTWANRDLATAGLRGSRDSILGAHPDYGGKFTIRTEDSRDPIVLGDVPRFVTTRGSVYCLVPGISALRHLAAGTAA